MTPATNQKTFNATQAAEYLAVDARTVRRLCESGELVGRNVSRNPRRRYWRISQASLEDFLHSEAPT
ncbi:MAG: helix-turn-helix domain-containing protein [Pirellulales bacterium]